MDSTDNFVEYGTPLEPLEEDEVPSKKPVTVQDQIAVDEQGRRRFHGAFTGGFSAGYYNTVGSKEGWTPSEFKSSRQSRTESSTGRKGQNVQDFMDEEDLGAFGIAPQILRATNDFEQREGRKRARPGPESSGPIPGIPVLEQIIQPVKETIGIRILQRMGWRPGQGVGPRLSKAERKAEREKRKEKKQAKEVAEQDENEPMIGDLPDPNVKVYGCQMPAEFRKPVDPGSDSDESILDLTDVTFAPDDFEDPLCNPKENTFGLGYTGLDRGALSFGSIDLFGGAAGGIKSRVENRKLNIRGEAFGIGAFEDEDEEVYNRSDMAQYDFSLETPEERRARRGNERRAKDVKKAAKTETGILAGFARAKNPPPPRKYFPAPPLPKNFEPKHYIRRTRFDQPPPGFATDEEKKKLGLDRHRLTIEERQVLLGEEKIPLTPAEVLELEVKAKEEAEQTRKELAIEKAERLKKFTAVLQTYSSSSKTVTPTEGRPGFKPFMKNPEKQERYEKYMTLIAAGFQECLKDLQPLEMTEWERERERMEFERASALYKPMGSIISSRFVSAQSHDISHLVPTKEVLQEKDPSQDPKVAAKMSLFGKLTHKIYEWHPDRLLCKRFNVPHPYPESKMVGVLRRDAAETTVSTTTTVDNVVNQSEAKPPPVAVPVVKKSLFDNLDFSKPPPGLLPLPPPSSEEGICPPGTETEQPMTAAESSEKSPLEPQLSKPSIDLFKEIFENSSSDESEEEPPPAVVVSSKASRFETIQNKSNRETKNDDHPPVKSKGIFDNLDFSKLQTPNKPSKDVEKVREESRREDQKRKEGTTKAKKKEIEEEDDDDVYGPPLPPPPISVNSTMSEDIKESSLTVLSKGHRRENPINSSSILPTKRNEDEETMWVEKKQLDGNNGSTRERRRTSSKGKESNKTHKQKKKLKKSHRITKSKKSKKRKETKGKKSKKKQSKKRKDDPSSSSESSSTGSENESDDDSPSSSDTDTPIQIHASLNNKALLAKLKSMF